MKRMLGRWGWATMTVGAGLLTVGCGASGSAVRAEAPGAGPGEPATVEAVGAQPGPVLVSCGPSQRALVRPTLLDGQPVSEVTCVDGPGAAAADRVAAPGLPYAAASYPAVPIGSDVRVVPAVQTYREPERRVVTERRVVYDRAPERRPPGRSVKKSAVIIGSSAGVGAGVGAAVGGKKGALIGAAIGGGSAAIWDQVTRDR